MRTVVWTGFAAVVMTAAVVRTAGAAVTVGSDLSHATGSAACDAMGGACTVLQRRLNGVTLDTGRAAGVIVRWRVRDATGPLRLRVLSGGAAVVTGPTVSAGPTGVQTFETRTPVSGHAQVAVDVLGGTLGYYDLPPTPPGTRALAQEAVWAPPLVDGQPPLTAQNTDDIENLYSFDIEADADGDGYGDETQDGCPLDSALQGACNGDLRVSLTGPTGRRLVGSSVSYAVHVTNAGSTPIDRATLAFALPAQLSGVHANYLNQAPLPRLLECPRVVSNYTCTAGPLGAGAQMDFTVLASVHTAGALMATVHASSPVADPNPSDNVSSAGFQALSPRATVRRQTVHVHAGRARIALFCQTGGSSCTGALKLSRHAGRASYRLGSGGKGGVTVRLSSAVLRTLHHKARLKLRASTVSDDHTAKASGPLTLVLRR